MYPREDVEEAIAEWLDRLINFGKIIENENFPITVGDVSDLAKRIGKIVIRENEN
jgi:hypothetical protein